MNINSINIKNECLTDIDILDSSKANIIYKNIRYVIFHNLI